MVDHDCSIQESLVTTARPPPDEPARSRVPVRHAASSEAFTGTAQEERTHGPRDLDPHAEGYVFSPVNSVTGFFDSHDQLDPALQSLREAGFEPDLEGASGVPD
jgi:hypothetical protein